MQKTFRFSLLSGLTAAGLAVAATASATPVTLSGGFVQVGISDAGTLGSNGNTSPGIRLDPTGGGTYGPHDYLTPGSPHESFAINSNQTGFRYNDNQEVGFGNPFGEASPTLCALADNCATWTGGLAGLLTITNTYFFDDTENQINITTTITALANLTNLSFGRSIDPDPDVNQFGSFDTENTRGNATLSPADFVSSYGPQSDLFLALLNQSGNTYRHNTGSNGGCCSADDPNNVLSGYGSLYPLLDTGDLGLQMAWFIGDLALGGSATINYAYVFGDDIDDVGTDPSAVPEPATMVLVGAGLAALVARHRRRKA